MPGLPRATNNLTITKPDPDRRCRSFLVRLWIETQDRAAGPSRCRGYVRDLRSGEERFLEDLRPLSGWMLSRLGSADGRLDTAEEGQSG